MADPQNPRSYPSRRYGATYKPTGTLKSAAEDIKKDPLGAIHTTLGGLGLLPAAGIPFDIADAAIYGLEALFAKDAEARKGALTGMTLAGAAAVPLFGWAPGLAKVGKNLTKASDEVMSLSKEAQEIAKKAEAAVARKAPPEELTKLNDAFKEITDKKLPKAQEKFNDLLTEAEEGLKAAQTNTVKGVEGATGGMSVKQRTKYLQETQELVSDIKAASQKEIAKFKEIRTAAKQNVKGAGKNVTKATDDVGYATYMGKTLPQRAKMSPEAQRAIAKNVEQGYVKRIPSKDNKTVQYKREQPTEASKQEKKFEQRREKEFTEQFGAERPIIRTTPKYEVNRFGAKNPAGSSSPKKLEGPELPIGDPRLSKDPLVTQSRRFRAGDEVREPVIVRPETII